VTATPITTPAPTTTAAPTTTTTTAPPTTTTLTTTNPAPTGFTCFDRLLNWLSGFFR
jgi:hypothetical protein